jgi:hypothetical protein
MKLPMKILNITTALLLALVSSTVAGNESEAMEQHFRTAELTAMLKHYEKVRSMQLEAQLDLALLDAEPNRSDDKLAVVQKRIDILTSQLSDSRAAINAVHDSLRSKLDAAWTAAAAIREAAGIIDPDPDGLNVNPLLDGRQRSGVDVRVEQGRYVEAKTAYVTIKARYEALFQ